MMEVIVSMFALEKDMTPVVAHSMQQLSTILSESIEKFNASALALELPVKYRIVDVVIAYSLPDSIPKDLSGLGGFKYLNGFAIGILSMFLVYKKVSTRRLKNELFLELDVIETYINKLLRYNLITQVSRNTYEATSWKSLSTLGLISIELKLCNWKEAMEQAEFNLSFSDYSFVALDKARISSSEEILPYFKQRNIGLLAVCDNGEIESIYIPQKNKNFDRRTYMAQRIKIIQDLALKQKWKQL